MPHEGKLLVLCVDRDNDIGTTLGVQTPILGEEALTRVAIEFALRRPEDSDANAIFAALQTLRDLRRMGYADRCEVALLAGTEEEGVQADMKILQELDEVLRNGEFTGAILVSDGPTDEVVAPLIQSRIPLISIRRVVVQQSRGVEETFVLLVNYVKKLFLEEKYRKYSMGLTGAFLAIYTILSAVLPQFAWTLVLASLGGFMFVKGYGIDKRVAQIYQSGSVRFIAFVLALLISVLGFLQGFARVLQLQRMDAGAIAAFALAPVGGQLIAVDLFVIGATLFLVGGMLEELIAGRVLRISQALFVTAVLLSRQIVVEMAKYLAGGGSIQSVLTWSFVELAVVVIAVSVMYMEAERSK
ncbi:MAG: DUF373 family protein [Thermofilum sp.]